MKNECKILVLESANTKASLAVDKLMGMGPSFVVNKVPQESFRKAVLEFQPDVIFSDTQELSKMLDGPSQVEQLKSEIISTVSYELRGSLTIIRESIAQIKDELCGAVTPLQGKRLLVTLKNLDRVRLFVEDLGDIAEFESKKRAKEPVRVKDPDSR